MKRLLSILILLLVMVPAAAQERHNYLAVNGTIVDGAGPYYFISYGDSSNAYAKAGVLADAMGLTVHYLASEKTLVFSDGYRTARFAATSDVREGLVKAAGTVSLTPPVGGQTGLSSPKAILVDGVAYVAVTPLVTAFEGSSSWNSERHVITIDTAEKLGYPVTPPRTGLTDGVSRVAVDLPAAATFQLAAGSGTFLIVLPGARSDSYRLDLDDPNVASLDMTANSSQVTVAVRLKHEVDPAGAGFKVGVVDKQTSRTLYIDFAPGLKGTPVTALTPAPNAPQAEQVAQAERVEQALLAVPEQRQVVVIDAGHGGHDPGTVGHSTEKHIVLAVALQLRRLLEAEGIEVVMTRDTDTFITLQQRSLFATPERNVFVSIHANSGPSKNASGIETWVFGEPLDPSYIERAIKENGDGAEGQALTDEARRSARDLAGDILREAQLNYSLSLAETVQRNLVNATGARDRGVKRNLFYVIRTARIPAILVELGFTTNAEEGAKLASPAYQTTLATALADGLLEFLRGGGMVAKR